MVFAFGVKEDGTFHNEHFGDSDKFIITKYIPTQTNSGNIYEIIKTISNPYKDKNQDTTHNHLEHHHHGEIKKAKSISHLLNGVDVVVAKAFGPNINNIKKHFKVVVVRNFNTLNDFFNNIQQILPKLESNNNIIIL